jgi:hypothetical protein
MRFPISRSGFEGQDLSVETAGFFGGARVLHNGNPVERRKGRFPVRSNQGQEVLIRLKSNFLDPIPKVIFGDQTIVLARPLTWYEYLWIGLPVLLVLTGGALGAIVGVVATYASARIFRSDRSAIAKYALTALVSLGALVAFAVLALVAQQLIGAQR